ncbi:hypothetical protein ACFSTE_08075 [Aquimarina hainanensis]|uniref:Uncharacterized protein n=1 Tax=Aquimarina hainanensis TaxID=1578017 RepID=A0ABW5N7A2_9FLAO|nr:hypothetical protein [Aquimarina sp. TRL1]QKX05199.1 hypothetical protein HN014_09780 [Aquimarina sp. TRL1]
MKNLFLNLIFTFFTIITFGQQANTSAKFQNTTNTISKQSKSTSNTKAKAFDVSEDENICYSETSRVAFYEALIDKNGFDIELRNSKGVAIKSTEEIISKAKSLILYSEEDQPTQTDY